MLSADPHAINPGFCHHRSPRMESLVGALAEVLAEPLLDPLAPEVIVVPGRGMAQWLTFCLATQQGVWAHPQYLYPHNFIDWALQAVLGDEGAVAASYREDRLLWTVLRLLREQLPEREFEALRRYVQADTAGTRYFELCRRIARTFDRYIVYRPDLLLTWQEPQLDLFEAASDPGGWQRALWKVLVRELGPGHTPALHKQFAQRLKRKSELPLPPRVCCVGGPNLPPSYLDILVSLASRVQVHLFQLVPRQEHGEEPRHPLTRSLGELGREFEQVLAALLEKHESRTKHRVHNLFSKPSSEHLPSQLQQLQLDIQADRWPSPELSQSLQQGSDGSIRVHSCHSPMREVEVLHDQLLSLFAQDEQLEPQDIVVMMPDVEQYAPFIEAVFDRELEDATRIPFSIADRALHTTAPIVDGLSRLFALSESRLSAPEVMDLLSLEIVARRFDIQPVDLEQIAEWLRDSNVRWGADSDHKQREGHPQTQINTWRFGLERLLLGYCVVDSPGELVLNGVPVRAAEGSGAQLLGKLCAFIDVLFDLLEKLREEHSPSDWRALVNRASSSLFAEGAEFNWQHQQLQETLASLEDQATQAGFSDTIPSAAFAQLLLDALDASRQARAFLAGGVTFCSMVPLRSVPFRVLCVLGLSDGQYPRGEATAEFDLMSASPGARRPGDRSRRSEDRHLLLEAILSARQHLHVSYVGQSIRDNTAIAPSVVVSELLDCLDPEATSADRQGLLVTHPLQAFDKRYFSGKNPRLFSFEERYFRGASAKGQSEPSRFFESALPALDLPHISLEDLVRFMEHPTRYLLRQRLDLYLHEEDAELPHREPQELSPLDYHQTGSQLLSLLTRGLSEEQSQTVLEHTGGLPLGPVGQVDYSDLVHVAQPIAQLVRAAMAQGEHATLLVDKTLPGGHQLSGALSPVFPSGLLSYGFSRVRAKHLVRTWIRHLAYCWVAPEGESSVQSWLLGRRESGNQVSVSRFRKVEAPEQHLADLVALMVQGQTAPLPFFPAVSLELARRLAKPQRKGSDLGKALDKKWQDELRFDPDLQRVFGEGVSFTEALAPEQHEQFQELSRRVFQPLLSHLEEGSDLSLEQAS